MKFIKKEKGLYATEDGRFEIELSPWKYREGDNWWVHEFIDGKKLNGLSCNATLEGAKGFILAHFYGF